MKKHSAYCLAIFGILLLFISLFLGRNTGLYYFHLGFLLGLLLFLEMITYIVKRETLLLQWKDNQKKLLVILILGIFTGIFIFDAPNILVFDLWEYPVFHTLPEYLVLGSLAWALFFLIFYESYDLLHTALHPHYKRFGIKRNMKRFSEHFFSYIGVIGIILFIGAFLLLFFTINPWVTASMIALSIWFILESIEFHTTKRTLLLDIIHGNFRPFIAILMSVIVIGFLSEYMNVPMQNWVYHHVPHSSFHLGGVPVFILFSWTWMYIIFLSLYKIIYHGDKNLWK